MSETLSSPCVNICRMDQASGLCLGCARSMDEISLWARLSESERLRIMADLPARFALIRTPHSRCAPRNGK
jgi:predicted Fe-S protein YdhL (DUF1289 family)